MRILESKEFQNISGGTDPCTAVGVAGQASPTTKQAGDICRAGVAVVQSGIENRKQAICEGEGNIYVPPGGPDEESKCLPPPIPDEK